MATTHKESGLFSGAAGCLSENGQVASMENSWAERSDEFLCKLNEKNAFSENDSDRFFLVKRNESDFHKTSPFLIQKGLLSVVGDIKSVKKLRSGELLVEVYNSKQATNLKKCQQLANIPITVSPHRTLNSCRGVISENDLLYVTETELLENLKNQRVINVNRIYIRKTDEKIPTKHIILTFAGTTLPSAIKAGYLNCKIRPYIPNPLRCFKCQRFGHSQNSCRGKLICGRCSAEGHESNSCNEPYHCVNCQKDHPSYSKNCEKWKLEKEIQIVRTKQNLPYPEAKKLVTSRTPIPGLSYAAVSAPKSYQKTYRSVETQTVFPQKQAPENKSPAKSQNKTSATQNSEKKTVSTTSKIPSHKRTNDTSTFTKPANPHNKTSTSRNLPSLKTSNNLSKKKKKYSPPQESDKNELTLLQNQDALSLHPSDSSDNDDNASGSDDMDIVI